MPLLFHKTGKRVAQALEVIYEVSFVYSTFKAHLALHGNVQWVTKTKVIKALEVTIRRLQSKFSHFTRKFSHFTRNWKFEFYCLSNRDVAKDAGAESTFLRSIVNTELFIFLFVQLSADIKTWKQNNFKMNKKELELSVSVVLCLSRQKINPLVLFYLRPFTLKTTCSSQS